MLSEDLNCIPPVTQFACVLSPYLILSTNHLQCMYGARTLYVPILQALSANLGNAHKFLEAMSGYFYEDFCHRYCIHCDRWLMQST